MSEKFNPTKFYEFARQNERLLSETVERFNHQGKPVNAGMPFAYMVCTFNPDKLMKAYVQHLLAQRTAS